MVTETFGKIQFKVNKVKIQYVEHCCSAGLGSLVPIEQLYPSLFTLPSGARAKSQPVPLKNNARATWKVAYRRKLYTFFINGDFGTETRLVCFLVDQYLFPTTKLTCFYVLSLLKSLNNRIIQILYLTLKLTLKTNPNA